MQKLDCRIHELQVCIPNQGIWRTGKKKPEQPDPSNNHVPRDVSIFQNRNSSGYAAVGRTSCGQVPNLSGSEEDEVKLIWEARTPNQTDPTPDCRAIPVRNPYPVPLLS